MVLEEMISELKGAAVLRKFGLKAKATRHGP